MTSSQTRRKFGKSQAKAERKERQKVADELAVVLADGFHPERFDPSKPDWEEDDHAY